MTKPCQQGIRRVLAARTPHTMRQTRQRARQVGPTPLQDTCLDGAALLNGGAGAGTEGARHHQLVTEGVGRVGGGLGGAALELQE